MATPDKKTLEMVKEKLMEIVTSTIPKNGSSCSMKELCDTQNKRLETFCNWLDGEIGSQTPGYVEYKREPRSGEKKRPIMKIKIGKLPASRRI